MSTAHLHERWEPGETAWFEYHCWEDPRSADAPAWYRSHQQVAVLAESDHDGQGGTAAQRLAEGTPKVYRVQFADGLMWDAFEDELLTDPAGYHRPDPPPAPQQ